MPTIRQRRLAREIIESATMDNPPTKGEMVEKVGYGPSIVDYPSKVIDTRGVRDALAEYGLTEELITTALVSDIYNKEKNRLGELKLGADILGMTKHEDSRPKNTLVFMPVEILEKYKLNEFNPSTEPHSN